jgi:hypothetical protein
VVGVIHSQSQTGLTPGYLGRGLSFDMRSRASENMRKTIQRIGPAVSDVLRVSARVALP